MAYRSKLMGFAVPTFIGICLIFFTLLHVNSADFKCPQFLSDVPNVCERITCGNRVSKQDCPSNTIYMENFAFCGCCPSCVQFRNPGDACKANDSPDVEWTADHENCDDDLGFCPVKVNTCLPGFLCNAGICEFPTERPNVTYGECMFRKSLRRLDPPLIHWDAQCEADGSFSPKQCKGSHYDGECFCVNMDGNRIFGREWRIDAENQTCECSRKADELRNKQGLTATFHCTPDGNFEPLQCDTDTGLCYCVNTQTGQLDGAVVAESQWKSLPCFSFNFTDFKTDGKYLRKCESKFAGFRQLQIVGKEHGITSMDMEILECDFDGSYAPKQIVHTNSECTFKNGSKISDYSMPREDAMTCNCARDKYEYLPSQDKFFNYGCVDRLGNYDTIYDFGSYASCVDKDGFLYGDVVASDYMCCLFDSTDGGCLGEMTKACYEVTDNPDGFKPCSYWWYRS